MKRIWRIAILVSMAAFLAAPWLRANAIDIRVWGLKVGVLDASMTSPPHYNVDQTVEMQVTANFKKIGQDPGGQSALDVVAPLGTTYMQTVLFTTDLQQKLFKTAGGAILTDTVADPPMGGYKYPDGTVERFDNLPWYSTATPTGVKGDVPPRYSGIGGNQFQDTPTIPMNRNFEVDGLAGVLNGNNGSILFQTALVGSCNQPANPLSGVYFACVLGQFSWGFDFTYTGSDTYPYNINDYIVAALPFTVTASQNVSAAFQSAFDQTGANAGVEWKVHLIPANSCPEPTTFLLVLPVLLGILRRRKQFHSQ